MSYYGSRRNDGVNAMGMYDEKLSLSLSLSKCIKSEYLSFALYSRTYNPSLSSLLLREQTSNRRDMYSQSAWAPISRPPRDGSARSAHA